MQFNRYAVYYTPPKGPLADFGASWLGWDVARGKPVPQPEIPGLPDGVAALTKAPRKYGFHGTLKPPFRLAEEVDLHGLQSACAALADTLAPVSLAGLEVTRLGGFLALTIPGDQTPLADLAGVVVRELDPFRARLTDAELARRRKAKLSDRQDALLREWGYPHVMEEFRFHITLTGRVARKQAENVRDILAPRLTPYLPNPFRIDDLTLVGEDSKGRFHAIHRYPLHG